MTSTEVSIFLRYAKRLGITPNFWLTQEYLEFQDAHLKNNGKYIWIQEDDWAIFPPLPIAGRGTPPPLKVWSDFENYSVGDKLEFLDWEYVYDPEDFQEMKGGKWKTFRKNSRKWPRRNDNWSYQHVIQGEQKAVNRLLRAWLEPRGDIADADTLLQFAFSGKHRKFLLKNGELVGLNIWDYNEPYMMYRYCITDPAEPYLDEFARLLFYGQNAPGRLVIDGGVLDNPGLERFKDRLNPIKKRKIYSRRIGGNKYENQ